MLQEHYAQINANWTRDVWAGTAQTEAEKQWPAVKAKFPKEAEKITWEQYRHYSSLVSQPQGPYKQAMGSCRLCQGICTGFLHLTLNALYKYLSVRTATISHAQWASPPLPLSAMSLESAVWHTPEAGDKCSKSINMTGMPLFH